ncbi:MAG TPA: nitrate reductase molybdenum cofactor assembly chaperone [Micromonosporaceae bacterium]
MTDQSAVAAKAASLLLRYPDAVVLDTLPTLRAALTRLPRHLAEPLSLVADHHAAAVPGELAARYVETFDFRRRCALHLTYYTHGDTRTRGEALVRFAAVYRSVGYEVAGGELPDHLPTVLDLAATTGEVGWALLREHRVGIELLGAALERDGSVYRHVLAAVRSMLPAAAREDITAAAALAAAGPPMERVGLVPYGAGGPR